MSNIAQVRLERLTDERARMEQNIEDARKKAEEDNARDLNELETEQIGEWRTRIGQLDTEIEVIAEDLERVEHTRDVSRLIRVNEPNRPAAVETGGNDSPIVYRTYAAYARDVIITKNQIIANLAGGDDVKQKAMERLSRAIQDTTSSDVEGLVPPQHMAQIMDIINRNRPVVSSARSVDLSRGKLTYPKIKTRPTVAKQGSEKTQGGSVKMEVTLEDVTADTYIGAGDLSWQTINWSTPDALTLWFDLAAEAYAQATETAACTTLAAGMGTASPALGTAGTEDLTAWRASVIGGIGSIYTTTGGRARTNTLYLSADEFFNLAALGSDQVLQMSAVGNLDVASMTGTFSGLRVVGSYGFAARTRLLGDSDAFLAGETAGAPVELRAVEPSIGGMEVGVIGAFQSVVFDTDRFLLLNAHA